VRTLIRWFLVLSSLASGFAFAQPTLHLKTRNIETGRADSAFTAAEAASPRGLQPGHLMIQFQEAPTAETMVELAERGVRVLADVPENGLLVSIDRRVRLKGLGVRYAAPIDPADKISPLITQNGGTTGNGYYLVEFHPDVDLNQARGLLLGTGIAIEENPDLNSRQLMIHLAPDVAVQELATLAALDEVAYIFPASDELANRVPMRACEGALTTNGSGTQSVPTYGDGWDGPGLGAATVSYVYSRMTTQLDASSAQSEVQRAMAEWSKAVKITWQSGANATGTRTVNILWASGDHGDGFPFDGPGNILAHTFYPAPPNPEPIAGDMHFDDAESWHIGANIDLFSVALHELGHTLGLGHSDDPNDVMYPYYKIVTTLAAGDKAAALTLYAAQDATPPPPTNPTTPAIPLTLTVAAPPSTTTASSMNFSGSAAGGSVAIVVTWSMGGASGTAAGPASAWNISNVPLAIGANTITITATAGTAQVSNPITVTRLSNIVVPTPPPSPSDTTPPSMAITSPASSTFSTTLASIVISGTAGDNVGVARVTWANNFGASGMAAGTNNWSATVPVLIGSNAITIRAFDAAGNSSWRTIIVARH
jgi:hypothetical protein